MNKNNPKKPLPGLNIRHHQELFAQLLANDHLAIEKLLAKAEFCKKIAVPKNVKPRIWKALQKAAKEADIKVFLVNYKGVPEALIEKAREDLKIKKKFMRALKASM